MNRKFKSLLSAAGILMATGLFLSTPALAEVKLRWAHVGTAGAPQTLYAEEVAKLVRKEPMGAFSFNCFQTHNSAAQVN
jgi:TRAP-type C4-dicarboxylate transport system substrate-binding protein